MTFWYYRVLPMGSRYVEITLDSRRGAGAESFILRPKEETVALGLECHCCKAAWRRFYVLHLIQQFLILRKDPGETHSKLNNSSPEPLYLWFLILGFLESLENSGQTLLDMDGIHQPPVEIYYRKANGNGMKKMGID